MKVQMNELNELVKQEWMNEMCWYKIGREKSSIFLIKMSWFSPGHEIEIIYLGASDELRRKLGFVKFLGRWSQIAICYIQGDPKIMQNSNLLLLITQLVLLYTKFLLYRWNLAPFYAWKNIIVPKCTICMFFSNYYFLISQKSSLKIVINKLFNLPR